MMYVNGIFYNGLHSMLDFDATTAERDLNPPERDRITDRPPYSSQTYDFTELFGTESYPERILRYKFIISDENGGLYLKKRVSRFRTWLYELTGKSALYDDTEKDYHFNAVCNGFSVKYKNYVMAEISVTFAADPYMLPNVTDDQKAIPLSDCRFPDLNDDGRVSAVESSMILSAAANIRSGLDSGLTEEQEFLADTDRDGEITAKDAALVSEFATLCGSGYYDNSPEGWTEFINYHLDRFSEVI